MVLPKRKTHSSPSIKHLQGHACDFLCVVPNQIWCLLRLALLSSVVPCVCLGGSSSQVLNTMAAFKDGDMRSDSMCVTTLAPTWTNMTQNKVCYGSKHRPKTPRLSWSLFPPSKLIISHLDLWVDHYWVSAPMIPIFATGTSSWTAKKK